ncbi:MAG: flagellar basal body rod protein FlgC [Gemmatimonadaceae bacterium]|nr:flagellar basal body rod protein FlgC [Gemmatimonadaceae bacterium]
MPINPTSRPALLPIPGQNVVRPMFKSLGIAASGIAAQRQRMEVIAQNIANADVVSTPEGTPYKRQDVVLQTANAQNALFNQGNPAASQMGSTGTSGVFGSPAFDVPAMTDSRQRIEVPVLPMNNSSAGPGEGQFGVVVAGIAQDEGQGHLVYEPGNPMANADGFVRYPDIDTTQETVKLLDAKRMYEANATVFQTAKAMLRAALDI